MRKRSWGYKLKEIEEYQKILNENTIFEWALLLGSLDTLTYLHSCGYIKMNHYRNVLKKEIDQTKEKFLKILSLIYEDFKNGNLNPKKLKLKKYQINRIKEIDPFAFDYNQKVTKKFSVKEAIKELEKELKHSKMLKQKELIKSY
jgi:hypothetical protein